MSDNTSDTNILIYIERTYPEFYSVIEALAYDCGREYRGKTIIIPPDETIKQIKKHISSGAYKEAVILLRIHLLTSLFLTGEDFKEREAINWYLRKIPIKNVKDSTTVEIENGTLTLDTKYHPTINTEPGEERNNTSIWVLKGVIKVGAPIEMKKSVKNKKKGGYDDNLIVHKMDILFKKFALRTPIDKNNDVIKYLVWIMEEFMNNPMYKDYNEAMAQLITGYIVLDILLVFYNNNVFPCYVLSEIITKYMKNDNELNIAYGGRGEASFNDNTSSQQGGNDDNTSYSTSCTRSIRGGGGADAYHTYLQYVKNNRNLVINGEIWSEKAKTINSGIRSCETDDTRYRLLFRSIIDGLVKYNSIDLCSDIDLKSTIKIDNVLCKHLFNVFNRSPRILYRILEIGAMYTAIYKVHGESINTVQKMFFDNYETFENSDKAALLDYKSIADNDHRLNDKIIKEAIYMMFNAV